MRILLVMDRRVDRGSIQAATNYVRAGNEVGHPIALYGRGDERFPPDLYFSTDPDRFDYVVFLVESWREYMSALRMPRLLARVPRERRAILDADGMFNPMTSVDGYDRNYRHEHDRAAWFAHYRVVTDRVMQPTFSPRLPDVVSLPFYGYDPSSELPLGSVAKAFDLLCVGHNWWRWRQVSTALLPAVERVRDRIGDIAFIGSWWDTVPAGAAQLDLVDAFGTDPDWLRRLRIQTREAVPYTEVVAVMSSGRLNIMTQRPLFRELRLLTSKYFEIFAADTIPLVMLDADLLESVYGPAGRALSLADDIDATLVDALTRPAYYRDVVEAGGPPRAAHHSYRQRVLDLVAALQLPVERVAIGAAT